jgi:outer membrane immunogenic protein
MSKLTGIAIAFGVGLLGAVGSASADGMDRGRGYTDQRDTCCTWNGFYLGGHFGWAFNVDGVVRDLDGYNGAPPTFGYSGSGPMAGVQLGFNRQFQSIVAGIELEAGSMNIDAGAQFPPYIGTRTAVDSRAGVEMNGYAAVTGRLGFTLADRVLVYGKGGWGAVQARVSYIDFDPTGITLGGGTDAQKWLNGPVWGGGIEFAVGKQTSVKIEYLRFDVGDVITHRATSTTGAASYRFSHDISDIDTIKVGLNFKFDSCCERAAPLK